MRESQLRNLHLLLVKQVLQALALVSTNTAALVADAAALPAHAGLVQHGPVVRHAVDRDPHALGVIRTRKHQGALGVQAAEVGVQLLAVGLGELGAEGVDGDVECAPVCLECEDTRHDLVGWGREGLAECVEVFEVGLVQRVPDDFDIEVVQILRGQAVPKVRG